MPFTFYVIHFCNDLILPDSLPLSLPFSFLSNKNVLPLYAEKQSEVLVGGLVVSNSLLPHGLQTGRLLCPWDSAGKNTGVGCHFLLQGIYPTQGSNPGLLHYRQILYQLSYKGSPHRLKQYRFQTRTGFGMPAVEERELEEKPCRSVVLSLRLHFPFISSYCYFYKSQKEG